MRQLRVVAPVRVADCGGWSDTWFARAGAVCSVAVEPGASVVITQTHDRTIVLRVKATEETYVVGVPGSARRHPLLEAAIASRSSAADDREGMFIEVGADVPPGCGIGTSAAVVVALLGALDAWHGLPLDPAALARRAHHVETGLGMQSGVQDQQAAAFGGVNYLIVEYPDVIRRAIAVPDSVWAELAERLVTVYVGQPHSSSAVHEQVIARLKQADPEPLMGQLRAAARGAALAIEQGDLDAWGRCLIANTDAQEALDARLICADMHAVISVGRAWGARGWKVNGAGGDGGSVTLLGPRNDRAHNAMLDALDAHDRWRRLALTPSRQGVRVIV